jgi:NAD(P)-dependent dehydrogenase (short-subunit alcohol dehydrogenase family)
MAGATTLLVVGGTAGIGHEVVKRYAGDGWRVLLTGRDGDRAKEAAAEVGGDVQGLALDLSRPTEVEAALAGVDPVDHVVLCAIARDHNTIRDYDIASATYLTTMKLVGYTAVVHAMLDRISSDGSVVMFGGRAKDRPYPGSTTVSTVNAGVSGLMHTLALQLAPVRVNTLHPGIVADSPFWSGKAEATERVLSQTPTGRNVAMADIVDGVDFLLRNRSVNGIELYIDGGWLLQ